jgi:hypothetical protein
MADTVEVPISLLQRMARATEAFESLEEELEDFLVSQDRALIERLKKARESHLRGELRPFYPSGMRTDYGR